MSPTQVYSNAEKNAASPYAHKSKTRLCMGLFNRGDDDKAGWMCIHVFRLHLHNICTGCYALSDRSGIKNGYIDQYCFQPL